MVAVNDPAGTAVAFAKALRLHTSHECRLVTTELRYNFMYEKDLHVPWLRGFDELEAVLKGADLFHFHTTADEHLPLGPFRVRDFLRGQPVVHHHHGEPPFRAEPRRFAERELALGRAAVVSTPDLLRSYPEAAWVPNPVPLFAPGYRPLERKPDRDAVRVGHSPTRRELKNTAELERVLVRVARRDPRVRLRLIEGTPHGECLRRKRECDLFFDHMQGYFGVSSLEALSQGVPTLAGLDGWNAAWIRCFTGCDTIPWVRTRSEEELERAIAELAADAPQRRALGRESRAWMERHWNEARIARALLEVYERCA